MYNTPSEKHFLRGQILKLYTVRRTVKKLLQQFVNISKDGDKNKNFSGVDKNFLSNELTLLKNSKIYIYSTVTTYVTIIIRGIAQIQIDLNSKRLNV